MSPLTSVTAKANKFGLMDLSTKVSGRMTRPMVLEDLFMLMEMSMKESGKMISNMAKDTNHGQMAVNSMVFTLNLPLGSMKSTKI